jgi:hypothetical protein
MNGQDFYMHKFDVLLLLLLYLVSVTAMGAFAHYSSFSGETVKWAEKSADLILGALILSLTRSGGAGSRATDATVGKSNLTISSDTTTHTELAPKAASATPSLVVENADSVNVDGAELPPKGD